MIINRQYRIIKFWLKIIKSSDRKYVQICNNLMLYDIIVFPNKMNWAKHVRNLLNDTDFSHVWNNQRVANEISFLSMLRQRLQDIYVQGWRSRLNEPSRASLYKHISQIFCYKQYLDYVAVEKFRYALTRLSVASNILSVETGR